jgi:hypothetical protein
MTVEVKTSRRLDLTCPRCGTVWNSFHATVRNPGRDPSDWVQGPMLGEALPERAVAMLQRAR